MQRLALAALMTLAHPFSARRRRVSCDTKSSNCTQPARTLGLYHSFRVKPPHMSAQPSTQIHFKDTEPIVRKATTIDSLFAGKTFDLIKLDVQGAELNVMRGGEHTMGNAKALMAEISLGVQCELGSATDLAFCLWPSKPLLLTAPYTTASAAQDNDGGASALEVMAYLDSHDFVIHSIAGLHFAGDDMVMYDALFVKRGSPALLNAQKRLETRDQVVC